MAAFWATWATYGPVVSELVSTPIAAKRLGISARTVQRYVLQGKITPDLTLPGSPGRQEYRWDVENLRRQINALNQKD